MFLKGFLKKAAALLCLGSFIPVVPGWCGLERYVPSGRAGGGFGWEWSFWLAVQAISPEWACRLLGEKTMNRTENVLSFVLEDMEIVKICP
ncbi:MAG: hypothetical protein BWX98_00196 [Candidatus Aminicenantes bacterium ADurb.Bin147]|nr:MAG: hypothetical protein BWX98_00196 [Candidatus Aminicenantes bacterium ADurb.Bin147]